MTVHVHIGVERDGRSNEVVFLFASAANLVGDERERVMRAVAAASHAWLDEDLSAATYPTDAQRSNGDAPDKGTAGA